MPPWSPCLIALVEATKSLSRSSRMKARHWQPDTGTRTWWLCPDASRGGRALGRRDLLADPHEQGIGIIGTIGSGPMPPMVPTLCDPDGRQRRRPADVTFAAFP
jgi:hypothetical protein